MRALLRLFLPDISPLHSIESVRFDIGWGWATLVLLQLLILPIIYSLYRLEDRPCTPFLRKFLAAIRIFFVAGVVFLLTGPKFSLTGMVPQKNKFAVLIDTSKSMSIREDGISRLERVKQLMDNGFLEKIEQKTGVTVSLFAFSGQVSPLSREEISSFSLVADGEQTNITRAVTEVAGNLGISNIMGMAILTDGAHNFGDNPLDVLSSYKVPLMFLGVGKTGMTKDISVSLERPPAIGFLNTKIKIKGEVKVFGIATESILLEISENGRPFETQKISLNSKNRATFSFNIPCSSEGQFTYSVSIPQLPGELTFENNKAEFLLKVVKERLKVFLLAGKPDWELTFLKGVLRSDPNTFFNSYVRVGENKWVETIDFKITKVVAEPSLLPHVEEADVLILREVEEKVLTKHSETILKQIESGKLGLLLLAGRTGFKNLGYLGSKISEAFPIDIRDEEWRGLPCNFFPPQQNTQYAFLRLMDDPVENIEFYRSLPKFEGIFEYSRPKRGTEILLQSTIDGMSGPIPALLFHRYGGGNVALIAGGPLWPMGFKLIPVGKGIKPYTAFILNMLKWLANRKEDAQVVLELLSARGFVGTPLNIRVWVSDQRRQPLDTAQVSGTISFKDLEPINLSFLSTAEKGYYETTFVPPIRGLAEIHVGARHQGQFLGEAKGQVLIEIPTLEYDEPEVRHELMQKLASSTQGVYLPIERAEELLTHINPSPGNKREVKVIELKDSLVVYLVLIILPLIEWIVRRKNGFS